MRLSPLILILLCLFAAAQTPTEHADMNIEELERQARLENLRTNFAYTTLASVVVGGLVDGLNPCAFAALVFLVNYLVFIGKKQKEILVVGAGFTFGVFATYLVLMFGALQAVRYAGAILIGGIIVTGLAALLALVLSVYSFWDTVTFLRTGRTDRMRLQLSPFLKEQIHTTVRRAVKLGAALPAAVVMGCLVALFESACTGQVMLPVVSLIAEDGGGDSRTTARAIGYLIIYNLMFVVPLIIVFGLVAMGVSGGRFAEFARRKLGTIKIVLTVFFFWLAVVLVWQFVQRVTS
jgi:hypothetical protein